MDIFGLLWIPDIIIWIIILVVAFYTYGVWNHSILAKHGYPGPKPMAFMGNINMLMNPNEHFAHCDLTAKKQYGDVFGMYEGRVPTIVVFNTKIIKEVLVKRFSNFVDRRKMAFRGDVIKHSLLDVKGDDWRRIRNLSSPFFTTGKLRKNMELMDSCCTNLIKNCEEAMKKHDDLDVKAYVFITGAFTLETICLTAFGLQVDAQNDPDHPLLDTVKRMMKVDLNYWGFKLGFVFPQLVPFFEMLGCSMWPKGTVETVKELSDIAMDERRKSDEVRPDFIQAMLRAHEEGGDTQELGDKSLSDVEITAQVALFALAGYDTTSTTISFLLFHLANNPDCQDKLAAEIQQVIGDQGITYYNLKQMQYLDMCLEESLRINAPLLFSNNPITSMSDRMCVETCDIEGYHFPKDCLVVIPVHALHHDPDLWPDPETFNPERFSPENRANIDTYAYQAFGAGPRNCVGQRLAQIEVKVAAIRILQKFKVTVSAKTKMPMKLAASFFPVVEGGIYLNLERREAEKMA